MKQRDFKPCCICGRGVMHNNCLVFFRIKIESFLIDPGAVSRQHGFESMLGGHDPVHGAIAQAMGPDEDLAICTSPDAKSKLICLSCAIQSSVSLVENSGERIVEIEGLKT